MTQNSETLEKVTVISVSMCASIRINSVEFKRIKKPESRMVLGYFNLQLLQSLLAGCDLIMEKSVKHADIRSPGDALLPPHPVINR